MAITIGEFNVEGSCNAVTSWQLALTVRFLSVGDVVIHFEASVFAETFFMSYDRIRVSLSLTLPRSPSSALCFHLSMIVGETAATFLHSLPSAESFSSVSVSVC